MREPKRIVIFDDNETFCRTWKEFLEARYGERVRVETYAVPHGRLPRRDQQGRSPQQEAFLMILDSLLSEPA